MSWARAKFRNAEFHTETLEREGGRRGPTHEYPRTGEDEAPPSFREDLGLKTRAFPIQGYVSGDKYLAERDALISALEEPGPGELVHPTYGTRRVSVVTFRVTENAKEQRKVYFSIELEETEVQPTQPTTVVDAAGTLVSSIATARTAVSDEFLAKYSPGRFVESISDQLRSATVTINAAMARVTMETQRLATFKRRMTDFTNSIESLVNQPEELLAELSEIFDLTDSVDALKKIFGFDAGNRPAATTPSRTQEQTNFDASQFLIQRLSLIRAIEIAGAEDYTSYEEAVTAREGLTDLLDDQAETVSDDVYPDLLQLRADFVTAVPGEAGDLPNLLTHTPISTVCSLVLAHRLYGDVSQEADILDRNKIRNPCFLVGGRPLEVLSRG